MYVTHCAYVFKTSVLTVMNLNVIVNMKSEICNRNSSYLIISTSDTYFVGKNFIHLDAGKPRGLFGEAAGYIPGSRGVYSGKPRGILGEAAGYIRGRRRVY